MSDFVSYLFETNAVRICPQDKPFWYTSGKIGPYYINTHFIYGSEQSAVSLLSFIDEQKDNKAELPKKVFEKTKEQYEKNTIYHTVIDEMIRFMQENISLDTIDYISGGERRDWFFSYTISYLLNKPHITIFKDLDTFVSDSQFETTKKVQDLQGKKVLHIADLVTEASSYLRAWIPAVQSLGATLTDTVVVVDRMQGGKEKLAEQKVSEYAMVNIDQSLFDKALSLGVVNEQQHKMLMDFFHNPDATMETFLKEHPEFMENALHSDEKTIARAKLCLDSDFYHLIE